MSQCIPMKEYMAEVATHMKLTYALAGRPQKMAVAGDYLYWTQGKEQNLFRVLKSKLDDPPQQVIVYKNTSSDKHDQKLSKEEELLRERLRQLTTGVSSFRVRGTDHAIFYFIGLDLFIYYTQGPRAGKEPLRVFSYLSKEDRERYTDAIATQPNLCVQFVRDNAGSSAESLTSFTFVNQHNLYMAHLSEHPEDDAAPLTLSVEQITSIGDEAHPCGLADYIMQEEFYRYTGHYANEDYIIFSYIDSTNMRQVALLKGEIADDNAENDGIERMAYSRVGDPNTRTTIVVYERQTHTMRYVPNKSLQQVGVDGGFEYIPRFGFKGKSDIYLYLLNRTQEHAVIVSCPVKSLPLIDEASLQRLYATKDREVHGNDSPSIPFKREWSQRIPWAWINLDDCEPIFYGGAYDITHCAAVDTPTAHYHLYVRPSGAGEEDWKPLTCGTWNVESASVKVHKGRISFIANAEGRLKKTLYSIPLSEDAIRKPKDAPDLTRHTPLTEHVYPSYLMHGEEIFYCTSTLTRPAVLFGTTVDAGDDLSRRVAQTASWIPSPTEAPIEMGELPVIREGVQTTTLQGCRLVVPEVVTIKNRRGEEISASVFASPYAKPDSRASPLALYIYGGPHAQLVEEANFHAVAATNVQVLLRHGVSVAVVDNQMSNANGLRRLSVCKKNMGHFETTDYVDMVHHLCERDPSLDPGRVAIFGWSYGGYATLLAMAQAPEVFRIGLAGAPVVDWRFYDTGYTERYMGLLHEKPADPETERGTISEAYRKSSIVHFVKGFPDELHRVYITHGLLDENVHFTHTCHLINAMVEEGKPFHMLVYPGERHGLRKKEKSRLHYEATLIKTIIEGLMN
ncbi:unnamed protein product [Phytomonas sp. EM1]|nr:unnamed protein product [Phytomonas sp. EM1]|eukprot:CCW60105.1 unnamed protein product [Phytomonas sp. isolate EM1]